MRGLRITLFGRMTVHCGEGTVSDLGPPKVQELLAYLLVYRDRPHHREILADALWGDRASSKSRKSLRQSLWRLHCALRCSMGSAADNVLVVEPDWVRLNPEAELWLDVKVLEEAFAAVHGAPGQDLDQESVRSLEHAARLYAGDLLEGCYQDWCAYERERLRLIYLSMLDKLMEYCERRQEYENALLYGVRILRHEPARERTHRRLMRLLYMSGDRTAALRQYERCVAALRTELEVDPARRTEALCERIRADEFDDPALR
ncbi:MAG TPA: BTAD domain-containing putative transcriptional regulator [Anaerolineae bacterium]|nr:BTAD domain-containing putative transcriptional regulator [Anaerolineae bacterium]